MVDVARGCWNAGAARFTKRGHDKRGTQVIRHTSASPGIRRRQPAYCWLLSAHIQIDVGSVSHLPYERAPSRSFLLRRLAWVLGEFWKHITVQSSPVQVWSTEGRHGLSSPLAVAPSPRQLRVASDKHRNLVREFACTQRGRRVEKLRCSTAI